jgi:hypothetical protein
MCAASSECGPTRACVAGRCQVDSADAGATPEIQTTRRLVLAPVDIAYLRRGDAARPELPTAFTLGRRGDGDAVLLLKFSAPLAEKSKVVEAYVLLDHAQAAEDDPVPIFVHAARVVDPWDSHTTAWASLPRLEEARLPSAPVRANGPRQVRVDVRELVKRWPTHDRAENGIAIVAEGASTTGIAFSLVAPGPASEQLSLPRLELYVK